MSTIGQDIRRVREEQGVTQSSLALRSGTSQAAISDIERGKVVPSLATVERLLLCMGHEVQLTVLPMAMDVDVESLREARTLTPQQRLRRIASHDRFIRRGRQAMAEASGA